MLDSLVRILATCGTGHAVMPPTEFYNEGWMLRLVLDYVSRQDKHTSPLSFAPGAGWYSEALLPSRFLRTSRFVIAPASRIDMKLFDSSVTRESIENKVRRRVAAYEGSQDAFLEVFLPLIARIRLAVLSWESILDSFPLDDDTNGLGHFYQQCLRFNLPDQLPIK
ncbi:hypothetical protein [uncultured Azohydromonas sp.]|jgi:hypothetical protein|uniref:hypothetical protein n=1 Tax=uncultured Azohydromonas sp. TaxID=487342 RepID=UPI00261E9072|nr:hypothetical protein [uncultured Azohydromonas sp.]